jgi:hypothetical protein
MFVKATNGTVDTFPYNIGQLRRDNPNTSFPRVVPETTMAAYNMFPVGRDVDPTFDPLTQKVEVAAAPVLTNGKWMLPKTVVALTATEIADTTAAKAQGVRSQRDKLIADTDWMALSDSTLTPAWAAYRQALRDVTAQAGFPHTVDWPVKP